MLKVQTGVSAVVYWLFIIYLNNPTLLSQCRWSGRNGHGDLYELMPFGAIIHSPQQSVKPVFDTDTWFVANIWKKNITVLCDIFTPVLLMFSMIR